MSSSSSVQSALPNTNGGDEYEKNSQDEEKVQETVSNKREKPKFISDEASESSTEEGEEEETDERKGNNKERQDYSSKSEDSSEEEGDELNEYEKDDFLVDDDEEEVEGTEENEAREKDADAYPSTPEEKEATRKRRERLELADGDYELLEEAGVKLSRPGRLKRLRKAGGSEFEAGRREPEDATESEVDRRREEIDYESVEDEDEFDDFIDDRANLSRRRRQQNSALPDGVSERAVRMAREIFGDLDEEYQIIDSTFSTLETDDQYTEGLDEAIKSPVERESVQKWTQDETEQEFEKQVIENDIPEYIQEHFGPSREPCLSREELTEEANWIYRKAFEMDDNFDNCATEDVVKKISALLSFVHIEQFDIPFIAVYRREYLIPELLKPLESKAWQDRQDDWKYIWNVLDWDVQWYRFRQRKMKLEQQLQTFVTDNAAREQKELLAAMREALTFADDEESLADIESGIKLLHTWSDIQVDEKQSQRITARPKQRDRYTTIYRRGWKDFIDHYVLTPSQLAENMVLMYQKFVPTNIEKTPEELAEDWLLERNESTINVENFLQSCRFLFIQELAAEPRLRSFVHSFLKKEALLTSKPSLKGISDLDDFDNLKLYCSIYQKPIKRILKPSSEFAVIAHCQKLGYTSVEIEIDKKALRDFLEEAKALGRSEDLSSYSNAWNREIDSIIEEAFRKIISEQCREMEQQMERRSYLFLKQEFRYEAENLLNIAPLYKAVGRTSSCRVVAVHLTDVLIKEKSESLTHEWKRSTDSKSNASNNFVAVTISLSPEGEVEESLAIPVDFTAGSKVSISQQSKERLMHFLIRSKPEVICVGVSKSKQVAIHFRQEIASIWLQIAAGNNEHSDVSQSSEHDRLTSCLNRVFLVNETISVLYASVSIESEREHTISRRIAIGIGRFAQEPLLLYAAVANDPASVSSLEIHPFQNILSLEDKTAALRQALTFAVCNYIGADVNQIIVHDCYQPLLRFIGGLGPHKALSILEKLMEIHQQNGDKPIASRKEFITNQLMDKKVFFSAAGFIKITDPLGERGKENRGKQRSRQKGSKRNEPPLNPLERTRIHPENYGIAMKIAEEALRGENEDKKAIESDMVKVICEVMKKPHLLEELDLEAYADHLEKLGRGKMHDTLRIICEEFESPYRDWRKTPNPVSAENLFYIITGSNPDRLRCGAMAVATNCHPNASGTGIICVVEGEIRGYIHRNEIFDEPLASDFDLSQYLQQVSVLACRVLSINYEKFELRLSCRPSVLQNPKKIPEYKEPAFKTDPFFLDFSSSSDPYHPDKKPMTADDVQKERNRRMEARRKCSPITSSHPFFRNVSGAAAIQLLNQAAPGEIIIRPSSHSSDVVVLSFKVADGMPIVHLEVLEQQQVTNGRQRSLYYIGQEKFETLDEVIGRYAEPVLANLQEAIQNRKFVAGNEEALERNCKEQKLADPQKVAYCIGMSFRYPGRLVIAYLPGRTHVIREVITVLPQGYRFRKLIHSDINSLIDWFKNNFKMLLANPPQDSRATRQY
eukprot:jgi/Galph1/1236/GphlegSOOS_G6048.1